MRTIKIHTFLLLVCLGIMIHARASRPDIRRDDWLRRVDREPITQRTYSFSESLFESDFSRAVRDAVLATQFFQGMINNTLSPENFGGYMVQDAAYCYEAVDAFDTAASKTAVLLPDFAQYYYKKSASYTNYNAEFVETWKLKDSSSVVLGPAAATYVSYESKLASSYPKYLSIGILPCDMLWPWVAAEIDDQVPADGLYRFWVEANLSDGNPSSAQEFVDSHESQYNLTESRAIFDQGMLNELNFFRSACGEDLLDDSQILPGDTMEQ